MFLKSTGMQAGLCHGGLHQQTDLEEFNFMQPTGDHGRMAHFTTWNEEVQGREMHIQPPNPPPPPDS